MRRGLVALLGLALSACATPGVVSDAAPELYRGTLAAAAQTEDGFADANTLARQADVERLLLAAESPGTALPTIAAKDFTEVVSPETAAEWRALFAALTDYAQGLVRLTDPALSGGVGTALTEAGNSLNKLAGNSPALGQAAGLAGVLGGAIVQSAGEKKAIVVVRRTDPAFHDLLTGMAAAIGASPDEGLSATVASSWDNAILQADRTRYGLLPRGPEHTAARRELIEAHLKHVQARDESLAQLAALNRSLLALAAAHRAIAQKRDGDARAWIARVEKLADDAAAQLKAK
jgi:hypothetical protein